MARPEKPITGDGSVEKLARELRRLRALAGSPAPTYAQLAKAAHHSRSVLADAAAGHCCPTWEVTSDFITACGGVPDQEPWPTLWNEAHAAAGRTRDTSRQNHVEGPAAGKSQNEVRQAAAARSKPAQGSAQPDPWLASTPQEYRYQLHLLQVWSGASLQTICYSTGPDEWDISRIPYSTLHDALNHKRLRMPSLYVVRAIVTACGADVNEWVDVWRAINMKEFTRSNPPPAGLKT
ncbi:hypothetical protein [Streptosporangium carneum]|uniref:Helix-turn-helix domain-containing protein n=1 Tax=Streptosporangium carneum TaxID=47481 RepID=A0A9W6IAD6_9ACTN|nr:hypothetical protein [Streptosporangium carneum]GLK13939.1 hypothetical protein GCM10017600_73510 [Streptosporangium carneum]